MEEFNLDNFEIETSSGFAGKLALGTMLIVFAAASMITTFSFFAVYAPNLGNVIHEGYAPYIAGILGVLLFDLAGLGWTVLRAYGSTTSRQFWLATAAAIITISLALFVSGLYVTLSSAFDIGLYDGAGQLTLFGQLMQGIGVITMSLGFVLNFGFIAAYVNFSAEVQRAVEATKLAAYMRAARMRLEEARVKLSTQRTMEEIQKALPEATRRQGDTTAQNYLARNFGHLVSPNIARARMESTGTGGGEQPDYDEVERPIQPKRKGKNSRP